MDCLKDQLYEGIILAGRFETVSPLNHGSFGMVFMAKDLETNEVVAIKCLTKKTPVSEMTPISFIDDEDSQELRCHALLGNHPNIVNLIRSFETDTHIYLVLEFCSRGDLYEAIRTSTGPLQTEHVRQFMLQLIDAVDYIHSKGLYHRDIKPENIFLAKSGEMKLGDFGLATTQKWTYEIMVGSDRYMAPEQFDSAGAGYAPEKVDIWAIGICLLNILFSRNPFTAPTESDPLFLDFSRDMQSLFDVFPTMSQDTFEVILKCMSLDPRKRSLDGAREALERLVSFTTADEVYDDFSMAERRGIACANREPLRTPSIQSPQNELANFHWTKEMHAAHPLSIQQQRFNQSDDESYSEDLFPKSDEENRDWFSDGQQSPSLKSVIGSTFEASRTLAMKSPAKKDDSLKINVSFHSSSLPTYLGSVFGNNNDAIPKSWNDLWEEDEQEEAHNQVKASQTKNFNSWRRKSNNDHGFRPHMEVSKGYANYLNGTSHNIHGLNEISRRDVDPLTEDVFYQEIDQEHFDRLHDKQFLLPVNEQHPVDKWSALGERRRAHTGPPVTEELKVIRKLGSMRISGTPSGSVTQSQKLSADKVMGCKGRFKGYPWSRGKIGNQQIRSGRRLLDSGDDEWVEG